MVIESGNMITNRKDEHIDIVINKRVESDITTWFDSIHLIHISLPESNLHKISIEAELLGRKFNAPVLIEGMTGGTKRGAEINKNLAKVAKELNIPMMVGSQRVTVENRELEWTFKIAREEGDDIFLIGNIGAAQLLEYDLEEIMRAINMVDADALAIHLNPLQESVQPEGDSNFEGILAKIKYISEELSVPIIVKETGAGISKEVAEMLLDTNIKAIDVAGLGGTSWSAIEVYRAKKYGEKTKAMLGKEFWNWGIPTAASVIEVKSVVGDKIEVIASGGIRNGQDIAKAIAIGADFGGMARPLLLALNESYEALKEFILKIFYEIRNIVFLTGSKNLYDLRNKPVIIFPPLKYWLESRKINFRGL
ncbi:MAG: type 2 isopentenyl-diphosphate Delta-isomerase [Candidatus Njordarchaeia archaeon]